MAEIDKCWPEAHDQLEILITNLEACCEGESGPPSAAIATDDTNSIDLSGDGTAGNKLMADLKVSAQAGNQLQVRTGINPGAYVAASGGGGGGSIVANDSASVNMNGNGTVGTPLTADVIISPNADNAAALAVNGVYVTLRETGARAALLAKQTAGTLVTGRWYEMTETKTFGGITGVKIAVMAIAQNRFSDQAMVIHPNFAQTAFPTVYDITSDKLIEVKDNRGNIVQGHDAILAFPFQYTAYARNTVRGLDASSFTWSALCTITNTIFDNPSSIDLTGFAGTITDCHFGPGSTVLLSGGDGGGGDPEEPPPPTPGLHVDGVLLKDTADNRFIARGANLEAYRDYFAGCGWATDGFYDELEVMVDKIVALGINLVRVNYTFSVLADSTRFDHFMDIMEEIASRGIYVMPSDHTFTGISITSTTGVQPRFGQIIDEATSRGFLPYLIMNPFNEPGPGNTVTQWNTSCEDTLTYLRTSKNFHGVVVLDGTGWATMLNVPAFQAVMAFDATLNSGTPNVMFSHHLYPNITGLSASIWAASDDVPLIMGEIGQYNATPDTPAYVSNIIDEFFSTGRPAGHNGLIAWILNWCDSNKMWEDWTNPSFAYSAATPLTPYGELWRDEYYSILAAETGGTGGGGGSGGGGDEPLLHLVTVIDATLNAEDTTATFQNVKITGGGALFATNTSGEWGYVEVSDSAILNVNNSTISGFYIAVKRTANMSVTGKTAGTLSQIIAEGGGSQFIANGAAGNLSSITVESGSQFTASGSAMNFTVIHLSQASVLTGTNAAGSGTAQRITIIDGTLTLTDCDNSEVAELIILRGTLDLTNISLGAVRYNRIDGGSIQCDNSVSLTFDNNHFRGATADFTSSDHLTFTNNAIENTNNVAAKGGVINHNHVANGATLFGSAAASTLQIADNHLDSTGTIGAASALDGTILGNHCDSGGTIDCDSPDFEGDVHQCHVTNSAQLVLSNAAHKGSAYFMRVAGWKSVEAAVNTGIEVRYGIHAGFGTYTYVYGTGGSGVRDND